MRAPVLVVADAADGTAIRAALERDLEVTVTDDVTRARALFSTGGFLVVLATRAFETALEDALLIEPSVEAKQIATIVRSAIARASAAQYSAARVDEVGAVPYDEYVELARYAITRRYLLALLGRHNGSVTDAAKGANLKRESLHRLMRRYHVDAGDFRE